MNNQTKALISSALVISLICISYTVGLHVNQAQALQTAPTQPTHSRVDTLREVYETCNTSRISNTITEKTCGDLQDATETEFICKERGTSPNIHCWVEDESEAPSAPYLTYGKTF